MSFLFAIVFLPRVVPEFSWVLCAGGMVSCVLSANFWACCGRVGDDVVPRPIYPPRLIGLVKRLRPVASWAYKLLTRLQTPCGVNYPLRGPKLGNFLILWKFSMGLRMLSTLTINSD